MGVYPGMQNGRAEEPDIMISSLLTPAEEAREVIETETRCHQAATPEPAFLIAMRWWNSWTAYSGFTLREDGMPVVLEQEKPPSRPLSINNNCLLDPPPSYEKRLKPGLEEGKDYKLVYESTWHLLHGWYGGEPACMRRWVGGTHPWVEVYALQLIIRRSSDQKEAQLFIPREARKSELKTKACQLMDLKVEDVRMWDIFGGSELYANMEDQLDDELTAQSNALIDKQHVLLEERDANGKFVLQKKKQGPMLGGQLVLSGGPSPSDTFLDARGREQGLAGLSNLGNTCFMNSSIQSLAHTVPLMRKFLQKKYESDINKDNPLGMKGELATAFGNLMDKLWQGETASVSPSNFKYKLGRFAPQFQGYGQQDSQELLAFLLDGLHEDLNRIKRKPYIEEKDADGRPDEEVAAEAWQNYRKRNDSTIVDHFQGLYKSTLICPMKDCQFHSIKFDPFMYLSLPLPDRRTRSFEVTVVHVDGSKAPSRYSVAVPIAGKVRDLYKAVAVVLSLPPNDAQKLLLLAEYASNQTLAMHTKGSEPLNTVQITNGPGHFSSSKPLLLAYHYASPDQGPSSGKQLLIYNRQRRKRTASYTYTGNTTFGGGEGFSDSFAPPLVLFIAEEQAQQLQQHTHQLEVDAAPSWSHFEYVLASDSAVNSMLETALRPFKRPRLRSEEEPAHGPDQARMVRSRPGSPSDEDSAMHDATPGATPAAAAPASNGMPASHPTSHTALPSSVHTEGLGSSSHHEDSAEGSSQVAAANNEQQDAHMQGTSPLPANGFTAGIASAMATALPGNALHGSSRKAGADTEARLEPKDKSSSAQKGPVADPDVASANAHAQSTTPSKDLKRMSWMEPDGVAASDWQVIEQEDGQVNGKALKQPNGTAVSKEDGAEWEDVPRVQEDRPSSPEMFDMDTEHNDAAPIRLPPGLNIQPAVPVYQPFNMFAQQQAEQRADSSSPPQSALHADAQEAVATDTPPYTLKFSNHLGDVRLQSCPSVEGEQVLYFTAQWKQDGGGVYDVSKLTHPEEDESVKRASGVASTSSRDAVGLDACLQAFQTAEELEAEDSWFCSKCKRHVQANKKLDLWAVPEVLVVHLKRFFFTRTRRDKLDVQVDFPLDNWDLSDVLPSHQDVPPVYDLYAVSNHFGGMGGGHYNAYCKMPNGTWWCFDDSRVHPVDKDKICSSSAYVLFYRRRHDAQQDTADLLADIMKAEPEDTDTRMSDAGDENSFARANQGDSPDWTTRPLHIIQAAPHAEDSATHDIDTNGLEEGEYPAQPDEAVSSPTSMFPATTADGAVFYLQDTSQAARSASSAGPSRSDVSMAAVSHDDASPDLVKMQNRSTEQHESATTSHYDIGGPPGLVDFSSEGSPPGLGFSAAEAQALAQAETMGLGSAGNDKAAGWDDLSAVKESYDTVGAPPMSEDDGYRSDIEEFQDMSDDDDLPKKDLFGDVNSGFEKAG